MCTEFSFQALSRELTAHETGYENISQLKNAILQDDRLSAPFTDNIKDEGNSLDIKWAELKDNVSSKSERYKPCSTCSNYSTWR